MTFILNSTPMTNNKLLALMDQATTSYNQLMYFLTWKIRRPNLKFQ